MGQSPALIYMSKRRFGNWFNKESHTPDSDWSSQEDSGLAIQPDHFPNIARPGGGFPEGKGEKSGVTCKTCNQNELVDGSCPLCDWGRQNNGTPGGNYPQDPYGTDMVHFMSKVGHWDFGDDETISIESAARASEEQLEYFNSKDIKPKLLELTKEVYEESARSEVYGQPLEGYDKPKQVDYRLKTKVDQKFPAEQAKLITPHALRDWLNQPEILQWRKENIQNAQGLKLEMLSQYSDELLEIYQNMVNKQLPGKTLHNFVKEVNDTPKFKDHDVVFGRHTIREWLKKPEIADAISKIKPNITPEITGPHWNDTLVGLEDIENVQIANFVMFLSEEMQADLYEDVYDPYAPEGRGSELYDDLHNNNYGAFAHSMPMFIAFFNSANKAYAGREYNKANPPLTQEQIDPKEIWNHFRKTLDISNKRKTGPRERRPHVLYVITSPVAIKVGITGRGFKEREQGYKQQNRKQFKNNPEWQWNTNPDEQREITNEAPGGQSTLFFDQQFDPNYLNEFSGVGPYRRNRKIVRSAEEENEVIHYVSLEMDQRAAENIEARIINWCRDDCGIQTSPIGEQKGNTLPVIQNEKGEEEKVAHMCESIPIDNSAGITPALIAYFIGIMANAGGKVPPFGESGREYLQTNFNISDENFVQMFSGKFGQELELFEPTQPSETEGVETTQPSGANAIAQPVPNVETQPDPQPILDPNQMQWDFDSTNMINDVDQNLLDPEDETDANRQSSFKTADVEGYSNWETFNTAMLLQNEQAIYEYVTELVRQGGTSQDLANWALITVVGPYNQKTIQDAQTWNEVPYEERPTGKENMEESTRDLTNQLDEIFGFEDNRADAVATTINESLINWDEIHSKFMDDIKEDEEWNHNDGQHTEGDPSLHPLCPVCNPENPDAPGDTTIPENWTFQ